LEPGKVFDHHGREQLAAHFVERGIAGVVGHVELDQSPGAHIAHPGKAQPFQGMLDRAALRIEHPILETDVDADFHGGGLVG
jgi:hypothetical protein